MTSAAATFTAIAGLLAALLGVFRYFNYKTNKDRKAAVGEAFTEVVRGLSSPDEVQRVANAILLRRFFDPTSEFAVRTFFQRKVPYADDAVNVLAAVLRTERTGNVQKVLVDGLAYAPSLANVDLQRTNLRNGYLGVKGTHLPPSMERTDFFRADLSGASFREAKLPTAVFYEASLNGTVFTKADLRKADFRGADLHGARFTGAQLAGAQFGGAVHLPDGFDAHLDGDGNYVDETPFEPAPKPPSSPGAARPRVFVSAPSVADAACRAVGEVVVDALQTEGAVVERLQRHDYSASSPLGAVRATMRGCSGAVILGLRQLQVKDARLRSGTAEEQELKDVFLPTPWNQIEAGMAAALELPLLVVSDAANGGVFDIGTQGADLRALPLGEDWDVVVVQAVVRDWVKQLGPPG